MESFAIIVNGFLLLIFVVKFYMLDTSGVLATPLIYERKISMFLVQIFLRRYFHIWLNHPEDTTGSFSEHVISKSKFPLPRFPLVVITYLKTLMEVARNLKPQAFIKQTLLFFWRKRFCWGYNHGYNILRICF